MGGQEGKISKGGQEGRQSAHLWSCVCIFSSDYFVAPIISSSFYVSSYGARSYGVLRFILVLHILRLHFHLSLELYIDCHEMKLRCPSMEYTYVYV